MDLHKITLKAVTDIENSGFFLEFFIKLNLDCNVCFPILNTDSKGFLHHGNLAPGITWKAGDIIGYLILVDSSKDALAELHNRCANYIAEYGELFSYTTGKIKL